MSLSSSRLDATRARRHSKHAVSGENPEICGVYLGNRVSTDTAEFHGYPRNFGTVGASEGGCADLVDDDREIGLGNRVDIELFDGPIDIRERRDDRIGTTTLSDHAQHAVHARDETGGRQKYGGWPSLTGGEKWKGVGLS